MLDTILKLAADVLNLTRTSIREMHEKLVAELSEDDARYAARTQLMHPKGSATPLNNAADRAQQTYDRIRGENAKALPKMMAMLIAERVAEQRRDETAAARDRQLDATRDRLATGIHSETRDLFARLFEHGVTPWHLKALSNEEVAIIADLIRWKAKDARFRDADNPWRSVLSVYARRLILKADKGTKVLRSTSGVPVAPKRYTDPRHYRFDEMVQPEWGAPIDQAVLVPAVPQGVASPPTGTPESAARIDVSDIEPDTGAHAAEQQMPEAGQEKAIGEAEARKMAELIYERMPIKLGIYWPDEGVARYDYDPDKLIPALERFVASDKSWSGSSDFLEAARADRAREFIADRRREGIDRLAAKLAEGDEHSLDEARRAGLIGPEGR